MTGRLHVRSGINRVLFPDSTGGLPESEVTIAQALKPLGYATCCVGKWHLGHLPKYLPTTRGFDRYFGIPYSNDMSLSQWPVAYGGRPDAPALARYRTLPEIPLMRDAVVVPHAGRRVLQRYRRVLLSSRGTTREESGGAVL